MILLPRFARRAPEDEQKRQYLDSLAEAHVIGKATPKTELREEVEPAHTHLLVRPQRSVQGGAGFDAGQPLRTAKSFQPFVQPGSRDHLGPIGVGPAIVVGRDIGAGKHAHSFPKTEAAVGGVTLDHLEMLEHPAQPLAIDLDPASSDQREPIRLGKQLVDLSGGQRLAVKRDFHAEVEERVLAQPGRRFSPDRGRYLRARRAV